MEIHASLRAEEILILGPVAITNSMLMSWMAVIVLITFAYFAGRNPQLVPTGVQNVFEAILEGLLTLVENTAGHYARRVFPLIATLFIYIVTANYMGLLPGVGTISVPNPKYHADEAHAAAPTSHAFGVRVAEAAPPQAETPKPGEPASSGGKRVHHEPPTVPLFRAANADVNMTFGMGIIAFLFIHYSGIAVQGLKGYWVNDLANPPMMAPVKIVIEMFVPVSLSMRLFGNIFGGEMLMTVMSFPFVAVPFMIMELLFGLIQAVIFSILTLIFTSLATAHHGGHENGHDQHGSHAGRAVPAGAH